MPRRHPSRPIIGFLISLGALAVACGTDERLTEPGPRHPPVVIPGEQGLVIREDFDNRHLIESVSTAIVDTNRGVVTLEAESFPEPSEDTLANATLKGEQRLDGILEGLEVLVEADSVIEVPDAIELRAEGNVTIEGTIRAGLGGVTVVAGGDVIVRGAIDSRGPIRILTSSPESRILVAGLLSTRAVEEELVEPPHITILGRGSLDIEGSLESLASVGMSGGDIDLRVYGPIELGDGASVSSRSEGSGVAGVVRVRSETSVTLDAEAQIGLYAIGADEFIGSHGQAIDIQAPSIDLADSVEIVAGTGTRQGGGVLLVATDELRVGDFARVQSGEGLEGGQLTLRAAYIHLGTDAVLKAGDSQGLASLLRLEAAYGLTTSFGSRIVGSDAGCGNGGDVRVRVGGIIDVAERTRFVGGAGSRNFSKGGCTSQDDGGSVYIEAQAAEGLEAAAIAGAPNGGVDLVVDPNISVEVPNPNVGTKGEIRSKIIDRGEDASGFVPLLVSVGIETPDETGVVIELSGANSSEGPFDDWMEASLDPNSLVDLSDKRFVRYRLRLRGRVFDAPVVDHFELLLAE